MVQLFLLNVTHINIYNIRATKNIFGTNYNYSVIKFGEMKLGAQFTSNKY